MMSAYPDEYSRMLEVSDDFGFDLLNTERDLFEIDHCAAGAYLAQDWGFPDELGRGDRHPPRRASSRRFRHLPSHQGLLAPFRYARLRRLFAGQAVVLGRTHGDASECPFFMARRIAGSCQDRTRKASCCRASVSWALIRPANSQSDRRPVFPAALFSWRPGVLAREQRTIAVETSKSPRPCSMSSPSRVSHERVRVRHNVAACAAPLVCRFQVARVRAILWTRSSDMAENRFSRRHFFFGSLLAGAVPNAGFGSDGLAEAPRLSSPPMRS